MKRVLLLFAIVSILFATACKKDNNDPEPKYGYRLTKMTQLREGLNDLNIVFSYEDDRIVGWEDIDGAGSEFDVTINYLENNVVEIDFYSDTNSSIIHQKMNYTFNGELIVKLENYYKKDEGLVLNDKTVYSYNQNGDVTETIESEFLYGVETFSYKTIYKYNGSQLNETIKYQWFQEEWRNNLKISYQYNNGLLVSSVFYVFLNEVWNTYHKDEFTYLANDNLKLSVSEIKRYLFVSEDDWEWFLTRTYQYDNDGNMTEEGVTTSSNDNYKIIFKYEEKPGNLWIFKFNDEYGYPKSIYGPKQNALFSFMEFKTGMN